MIDQQLKIYLEQVSAGEAAPLSDELLNEFKEECAAALLTLYKEREDKFRLRMSNIGRDTRSLWLEKEYGRPAMTPEFTMRMLYGHLIEKVFLTLLKAAGVDVTHTNEKVELDIDGYSIQGEYDSKIGGMHYDFKSASDWSYTNKFIDCDSVVSEDGFGYGGQAVAYSLADDTPFGGWFVLNKSTGDFKVVDGTALNSPAKKESYLQKFKYNIKAMDNPDLVPECTGVVDEEYYKKKSGNKIIGNACKFCDHKNKCHPEAVYRPSVVSKAKNKPWVWYTELNNLGHGDET